MTKNKEQDDTVSVVEAPERSEGGSTTDGAPSNEVSPRRTQRRYTLEYKQRMLLAADACSRPGELGALMRREGLYSSTLHEWRMARQRGQIAALSQKRGRKPKDVDGRDKLIADQQREISKLRRRAERAEGLVEIQKKVSQLLGIQLPTSDEVDS